MLCVRMWMLGRLSTVEASCCRGCVCLRSCCCCCCCCCCRLLAPTPESPQCLHTTGWDHTHQLLAVCFRNVCSWISGNKHFLCKFWLYLAQLPKYGSSKFNVWSHWNFIAWYLMNCWMDLLATDSFREKIFTFCKFPEPAGDRLMERCASQSSSWRDSDHSL